MIHHYASSLNAIPVLNEYRENPSDFYLLRVGYGGLLGAISNITQEGFAPCAFHSFPSTLSIDSLSGDYATGFLGYALNSATYITFHNEFGWLAFVGNCIQKEDWVKTTMTTAAKSRVFVAPLGLWMTLDAGQFKSVTYNTKSKDLEVELEKATPFTPNAYLHIKNTSKEAPGKEYTAGSFSKNDKGVYLIPLQEKAFTFVLLPKD